MNNIKKILILMSILVGLQCCKVNAEEALPRYTEEDYLEIIEMINLEYDVNALYFDEYVETQISPQELYEIITSKLQGSKQTYYVENHLTRTVGGEGGYSVEKFPIVATVTYKFYYNSERDKEYFSGCKNVTAKTSTAAASCNVVFLQTSYESSVLDAGRTLSIKVYGTYTDYNNIIPVSIENYKVEFELAYTII